MEKTTLADYMLKAGMTFAMFYGRDGEGWLFCFDPRHPKMTQEVCKQIIKGLEDRFGEGDINHVTTPPIEVTRCGIITPFFYTIQNCGFIYIFDPTRLDEETARACIKEILTATHGPGVAKRWDAEKAALKPRPGTPGTKQAEVVKRPTWS